MRKRAKTKFKLLLVRLRVQTAGRKYLLHTRETAPKPSLDNAARVGVKLASNKNLKLADTIFESTTMAQMAALLAGCEVITNQKLQGMTRGIRR